MKETGYDIIGDVHGHADKLELLLDAMGYEQSNGAWRHPSRQALFVGDLVDRGPRQLATVKIAKAMIDAGAAMIVAGNHEFNAIAWHRGLRERSDKNIEQHHAFLTEVGQDSAEHDELIDWFTTMPLWLDLGDLRVVHACWDPVAIRTLERWEGPDSLGDDRLLVAAHRHGSAEWRAMEHLLKGPEVDLAPCPPYLDKGGHRRNRARWRWWDPDADNLRSGALIPGGTRTVDGEPYPELPTTPLDRVPVAPYRDDTPVFYGHYWRTGVPAPTSPHTACLDYSAGLGGPLVAYRWSGESELTSEHYVSTESTPAG